MKRIIIYGFICVLFSSCSHRIVRNGYKNDGELNNNHEVVIQKSISIPDSIAIKVGEIKLGESGFSIACSEEDAIETLKNEATSINADLILITHEKRPDFWSSCYRCNSEFYKYNRLESVQRFERSQYYDIDKVKNRVKDDRAKNVVRAITAAIAGVLTVALFL